MGSAALLLNKLYIIKFAHFSLKIKCVLHVRNNYDGLHKLDIKSLRAWPRPHRFLAALASPMIR